MSASIIPLHPARFAHVTNDQFLQTIFGEYWGYAHVAAFPDPPDDTNAPRYRWAGGWWKDWVPEQITGWNTYYTISLFTPEQGRAVRRKTHFSSTRIIVIDDVGIGASAKVTVERLAQIGWPTDPSYRLETSPGNEQWGYILDAPCTDAGLVSGLLDRLVDLHLCPDGTDPGIKGVTRYVRLPQGINNKTRYDPAWTVRLNAWKPERRFSIQGLADSVGYDPSARPEVADAGLVADIDALHDALEDWPADLLLDALIDLGYWHSGAGGKQMVTCPNHAQHTDRIDELAAYYRVGAGGMGGGLKCWHGHCQDLGRQDIARLLVDEYQAQGQNTAPIALINMASGVQTYGLQVGPAPTNPVSNPGAVPLQGEVLHSLESLLTEIRGLSPRKAEDLVRAQEIVGQVVNLPAIELSAVQQAFRDTAGLRWTVLTWNTAIREARGGGNDGIPPALQAELGKYAYVARIHQFIHLEDFEGVSPEAFRMLHYELSEEAVQLAVGPGGVDKVDKLGFDPGQPPLYQEGLVRVLNGWGGLVSRGTPGDITPWMQHVEWLVPQASEREHLLDWMAFTLQYPGVKINHAILMTGAPGTGKDTLFMPLKSALGTRHAKNVVGSQLGKDFTWYLARAKLVIFQEVDVGSGRFSRAIANDLKNMIAAPPDTLSVNCKNIPQYDIPNLVSCIFLSNEGTDSIHISNGDRRYFVLEIPNIVELAPQVPKPEVKAWFKTLWHWMADPDQRDPGALGNWKSVVHWLLARDVSQFAPGEAPLATEAKLELIEHSRSPMGSMLHEMHDNRLGPFVSDIVRSRWVYDWLLADGYDLRVRHGFDTMPTLDSIAKESKAQWPGKQLRDNHARYQIVRNTGDWWLASPAEITMELDRWRREGDTDREIKGDTGK